MHFSRESESLCEQKRQNFAWNDDHALSCSYLNHIMTRHDALLITPVEEAFNFAHSPSCLRWWSCSFTFLPEPIQGKTWYHVSLIDLVEESCDYAHSQKKLLLHFLVQACPVSNMNYAQTGRRGLLIHWVWILYCVLTLFWLTLAQ